MKGVNCHTTKWRTGHKIQRKSVTIN